MNKSELIREIHERMDKKITLKDIDSMVEVMLKVISEKLKLGEEVQLAQFGTFSLPTSVLKSVVDAQNYSLKKKNEQLKKQTSTRI